MEKVSSLVSRDIGDYLTNRKAWGPVMYNVLEHGLIGNGVKDDTVALQKLIDLAISEGRKAIFFPHTKSGGKYFVTTLTNANQVMFFGDNSYFVGGYNGSIRQLGDLATNAQLADISKYAKYVWGMEYLAFYHKKLIINAVVKLIFSGDSTTFGVGITDPNFLLDALSKSFLLRCGISSVTSINAGHSSKLTSDWLNTYLAEDMAQNPDLYVVRWGFNDGSLPVGTRLGDFTTALRQGLATIRASKTADQMSIILMMPNSANDDAFGRNATWFETILPVVKQAARDFQCCFIDTYTYLLDSANVLWQDTPMSDGARIHPLNVGNAWIISLMAEALIPTSIRNYGVTNVPSSTLSKTSADAPSTYPFGYSCYRTDGSAPLNGEYFTSRSYDNILIQINSGYAALAREVIAFRRGLASTGTSGGIGNDAWAPWIYLYASVAYQNATLANSWVNYGGTNATAQYMMDSSGNVHLKGMIKDGVITAGTVLFTLPAGYRTLEDFYHTVSCNGAVGVVQIKSNGQVVTVNVSSNAWVDLGRIIYKAEQ